LILCLFIWYYVFMPCLYDWWYERDMIVYWTLMLWTCWPTMLYGRAMGMLWHVLWHDSNDDMLYGRVRFDQCFNVSSVFMGDAMTCPNVFIFLWAVTMTMLWHADMICYTMLCYAILWHAMVCYDVLCTKRSQNVRGLGG
jgi:hypothetical protein